MDKYLGKRLDGRYEMRELIGVGGMAYVYKAYDAVDDRIVAVKILKDEFLNSDEFVRRFRNESKAIAILNHPNIVKVLDVGFGERLQYIVMEYIDGITLKEYLDQRKDIRWKEAVHFTVQILRALQHAHDKGIVHRDIKPQNIMLLSDGTIKVTDFGIARLTRSDMKATVEGNKAIGSVHYISPEQARGEITDEKTDLYAVGIMLYEMLTGCLPFEADNAVSVAIMQMQSEAKAPHLINAEIPEGLEQITLKAMQKDTTKRYQSAAEMLNDFEEFKKNPSIKFEYTYMVDDTPTRYVDAITRVRGESSETAKTNKDEPVKPLKTAAKKDNTKTIILIVVLCLVTILFGVLIFSISRAIGGHSNWVSKLIGGLSFKKTADEVVVDKFIGMMYYTDIEGNLDYSQKFDLEVKWEDANNPAIKKGEVYRQEPAYGKTVKKGATVKLYVNSATPKDITLDVRAQLEGEPKNDVRKLLQDAGFVVSEITSSSEDVPVDHVIKVEGIIPGQTTYPYGTKVTMVVSTGPSTLEPIKTKDIPSLVGETKEKAEEILRDYDFVGTVVPVDTCYSDDRFAEKGVVMGVIINGVIQETLPEEIPADGVISLAVSSGLKSVSVELEWPEYKYLLDVRVIVGNTLDPELGNKYNGFKPTIADKIVFNLNQHPNNASSAYNFEVQIKKHDAPDTEYKTYATLLINPVEGTWTMVGGYQPLPGISPEIAIPDIVGQTMSYDELVNNYLKHFNVTVQDSETNAQVTGGDSWKVDRILNGGVVVTAGSTALMHTKLTVKVSAVAVNNDVEIPSDIFSTQMSLEEIRSALGAFTANVIVKDASGNESTAVDQLYVEEIWYEGEKITSGSLPTGAAITVIARSGMLRIPDNFNPVGALSIDVKNTLVGLGFQVTEQFVVSDAQSAGRVLSVECNGNIVSAGQLIDKTSTIVISIAG